MNTVSARWLVTAAPRGHAKSGIRALAFLVALATIGLAAGPTLAATPKTRSVTFSGKYTGTVSMLIDNGSVTISSVTGTGRATSSLVGAGTVSGSGTGGASQLCDPFGGTGRITGPAGTISFSVSNSIAKGCSSGESGPVTVTFTGVGKATSGTGKAKGVTGSLKFSGSLKLDDTSGSQSGAFTATVSGTVKVPK